MGVRRGRRKWWLRTHGKKADLSQIDSDDRKVKRALAAGTLSRAEIEELIGMRLGLSGLTLDLVRVPPSGTWERRRADLYGLAESWVGPANATEQQGVEHLVRRYLQGFGPASPNDIANWIGGSALKVAAIKPALERLDLRRFQDEQGKELLDLPRLPLPDPDTPAPVRFLPVWDATLLVHARRTQILPERYRARVFNVKTPHSVNTFLVDGQVAGTWRYDKGRVSLEPFGRLSKSDRTDLNDEGERLAALHA